MIFFSSERFSFANNRWIVVFCRRKASYFAEKAHRLLLAKKRDFKLTYLCGLGEVSVALVSCH